MSGLRFPKKKAKKKRKQHTASILQEKDGTCYLCRMRGDESKKQVEEHHIFGGPNRAVSEAYGLKVYLCVSHHRIGRQAVHKNQETRKILQEIGQQAFERTHSRQQFMELFGKNYREEE